MAANRRDPVRNLGHKASDASLTKNPAGYPRDYENGPAARVINEKRSVGVYTRFDDPKSGISASENLDRWADYARSNSYHGDPRGRGAGSDNHLRSTKGWPRFDAGSESGEGRLEKSGKR